MRNQVTVVRAVLMAALFLFLTSIMNGQVQVLGQLYRDDIINPGETYNFEVPIINSTDKEIAVIMEKKDFYQNLNETRFLNPGEIERSNSSWIFTKFWKFKLPAKSKIITQFKVIVPQNVVGTYYSMVMIQTINPELIVKGKQGRMGIFVRKGILIISTIKGGKKDIEIIDKKFKDNNLILRIKNTGEDVIILAVKPDHEKIKMSRVRIFPNVEREVKLNCSGLIDGKYRIRILLDDGAEFVRPIFCEFRKGLNPAEIKALPIAGEKLAERKKARRRPVRIYLNLNYGSRMKGLSISGNFRVNHFTLSSASSFSDYEYADFLYQGHRISAGLKFNPWFGNVGTYFYGKELEMMTYLSTGLNLKNTRIRIGHLLDKKITSLSIRQRIFKTKYYLRFHTTVSQFRRDYNLSLSVPIL